MTSKTLMVAAAFALAACGVGAADNAKCAEAKEPVAWQVLLEKDGAPKATPVESFAQPRPRVETAADGARRYVYDTLRANGATFKVKLTVDERKTASGTVYTGLLENDEPGARVARFIGPRLARVDLDPASAALYIPAGFGRRLRHFPSNSDAPGPWSKSGKYRTMETGMYPSRQLTMPWVALETGSATWYASVYDTGANPKNIGFRWYPEEKNMDVRFIHPISVRTGEKWKLPETVFEKIPGDWHAAARRYRAWYDSVHALNAAVPDWTRDLTGWLLVIMKQQNEELMWPYTDIPKLCDVAERNGLNCIGLFGWTVGGHDHLYPDYDADPKMGGVEALKAGIAEAHRRGIKVCIYANGQLQQMGATEFWREHGERLALRYRDGSPYVQTYHKYRDIPVYQFALGCLCGQAWHDRMFSLARQAEGFGADAILYDQLGVTGPFECWGKGHGHPVPWHSYGAERPGFIRKIADAMHKDNKDFAVFTEGLHDTVLDSIGLFHSCHPGSFQRDAANVCDRACGKHPKAGEVFTEISRYTFPEVVATTRFPTPMATRQMANYAAVFGLRHEIEIRYMPDRTYVLEDKVPTREDYGEVKNLPSISSMQGTPPATARAYLKAVCDFQKAHSKYLMRGRFVDDEGFTCSGAGLLAKRFVADDGTSAVCVWNASGQPVAARIDGLGVPTGAFAPAGEPTDGPIAANSIRLYTYAAKAAAAEQGVFEEMVPMDDGVKLYTYGTRPAPGVKCPIVIMRNPYVKEQAVDLAAFAKSQKGNLARGYAYLIQHCRGCGMSEGDWIPYENERADGLALLAWARKLPWYNGEIFLEGGSYLSSVHWSYLDTNPPDVKGACLSIQEVNRYNIAYRNGFFKTGLHGGWFVKGYKKKNHGLQRDKSVSFADFPLQDFSMRYWGESVPALDNKIAHPCADDPFWRSSEPGSGAAYRRALLDSTMPVLLRTGFYDIYTEGINDMWRETPAARRANCALLIDAYDHGSRLAKEMKGTRGEFPGGRRADEGVSSLDWFDYCRTGRPCTNAVPGRVRYYALWENRWIEEDAVVDGPRRIDLPLGAGTRSWTYDPKRSLPYFPGSGGICFGGMRLQPEPDFRDDVVSYVLPPVEETIDVRGRMRARLTVTSDCEDTCFYVRVSVQKDDGKWYLLRDDITSLCKGGRSYVPGTEAQVEFRFADHAFRLEKGDRLRVDVASGNNQFAPHGNVKGPQYAVRTPKVAHNAVRADASTLTLFAK